MELDLDDIKKEVRRIRRDLHKIPETAFKENQTSDYIQSYLKKYQINFENNIAKTGVIAEIVGAKQSNEEQKIFILRADIDGLPIAEETGLDFASDNGNMHACGHDGHMAMLLVVSKLLKKNAKSFSGRINMIFQPAEEEIGGAKKIINEKPDLFNKASFLFGFHIWNQIETGKIAINNGTVFVSADTFKIDISGVGGHGAMPHKTVDPIFIASNLITSSQSIVSRKLKPGDLGVITFGKIDGGTAPNVIPERVFLEGTIRADSSKNREFLIENLKKMTQDITRSLGGSSKFKITSGTGPVINNQNFSREVSQIAARVMGEESVISIDPVSVGDDVSEFMKIVPSVYALLGAAKDGAAMHHNQKFDFDEECLSLGVQLMLSLVDEKLN